MFPELSIAHSDVGVNLEEALGSLALHSSSIHPPQSLASHFCVGRMRVPRYLLVCASRMSRIWPRGHYRVPEAVHSLAGQDSDPAVKAPF